MKWILHITCMALFLWISGAWGETTKSDGESTGPAFYLEALEENIWLPFKIPIVSIQPRKAEDRVFYFWFYENTFFDALEKGYAKFHGENPIRVSVKNEGSQAEFVATDDRKLRLDCQAVADGVNLVLSVTNTNDYTWSQASALCPCFFPGSPDSNHPDPPIDEIFRDEEKTHTYYLGDDGLRLLDTNTHLHFNHRLRAAIDRHVQAGEADRNWDIYHDAEAGLMVRESHDGQWVAGIGWEDFLSAQGHNPLHCMHLSVRVGALEPGQNKTVRGKIYLFKGNKEDCLNRFNSDFKRIDG